MAALHGPHPSCLGVRPICTRVVRTVQLDSCAFPILIAEEGKEPPSQPLCAAQQPCSMQCKIPAPGLAPTTWRVGALPNLLGLRICRACRAGGRLVSRSKGAVEPCVAVVVGGGTTTLDAASLAQLATVCGVGDAGPGITVAAAVAPILGWSGRRRGGGLGVRERGPYPTLLQQLLGMACLSLPHVISNPPRRCREEVSHPGSHDRCCCMHK